MPKYSIQTIQEFYVTYTTYGDDEDDAWDNLLENDSDECIEQIPSSIVGSRRQASIKKVAD